MNRGDNQDLLARWEYLLGEYERTRKGVLALRETLASLRATAQSPDTMVAVTVGPRGELESLDIDARAYRRLTAMELSRTILDAARQATTNVREKAAQAYEPFLPPGASYQDLIAGQGDLTAFLPEQPVTDSTFNQWWAGLRGGMARP